jgi:cytochrome c-type biogenesis protein CcmH
MLFSCISLSIVAKEAQPSAADPVLEERVMKLSKELRCLVCQNETLADSRADLAEDLRGQIREQMKAGKSDKEIIAYLTDRYGKFILYNPPVDPTTYLLWFGPFILLLAGLLLLFRYLKQRRDLITEQPLSAEERHRAEALLKTTQGKETA